MNQPEKELRYLQELVGGRVVEVCFDAPDLLAQNVKICVEIEGARKMVEIEACGEWGAEGFLTWDVRDC